MPSASAKIRAFAVLCFVAALSACTPPNNSPEKDSRVCLVSEVSSSGDAVLVKNSGEVPWSRVEITLLAGPGETKSFKFRYPRPTLQCASMMNIDLNRFVGDNGVAYDSRKYKLQGIRITTDDPFAIFNTTPDMSRDSDGLYENECKTDY